MSSYTVGQLSALMTSGSAVSEKKKKKAKKLNLLFSTPLPDPKEGSKKSITEQTADFAHQQFELSISPIEVTEKRKKKTMINEDKTQETIAKAKKKHKRKDNPASSNEKIEEMTAKIKKKHRRKDNPVSSNEKIEQPSMELMQRNRSCMQETTAKVKQMHREKANPVSYNEKEETTAKVKKKHEENANPVSSNEKIEENTTRQEEEMPASEIDAEKKQKMTKKRKREDSESSKDFIKIDDTRDARTIFVGNLPTSFDKEDLKALFRPFGKVESTRIRSAAPPKVSLPKKVAVIKHLFHPDVHSFNGFVVFETEEMANAALELDGSKIQGHHIRVDLANKKQEHDHKRSVFVGNIPFDTEDDDLWDFFKEIGDVRQVRIIRDRETRIGKGFGYVLFKTIDAAALALEKNGEELKGRPVRISRSTKIEKKFPIDKLSKKDSNKLYNKQRFQGKVAKKMLKMKKNKKIAKNRMRLKRKKMLAEKLQAAVKKHSTG